MNHNHYCSLFPYCQKLHLASKKTPYDARSGNESRDGEKEEEKEWEKMDKCRSEFEIINYTVTKVSLTNLDYQFTELN